MPRPSAQQLQRLEGLREDVLAEMVAIGMLNEDDRQKLNVVPLVSCAPTQPNATA